MRPRMYGSTERKSVRSRICPSARAGIGASTRRKSDSFGIPTGRAASVNWRLTVGSGLAALAVIMAALCQISDQGRGMGGEGRVRKTLPQAECALLRMTILVGLSDTLAQRLNWKQMSATK